MVPRLGGLALTSAARLQSRTWWRQSAATEPWDMGYRSLGLPPPPSLGRDKFGASNIASKSHNVPSFFHLLHDELHRWPAAPRQPLGSLDRRADSQPSRSQQILPARGRLHPSGSALDVICNSAFKGFVAEAHCLLSRSRKIIVELNSQEQLGRKQEKKFPTLNVKGHLKASRFQGF